MDTESETSQVRLGLALGVIAGALALDVGSLNVINAALPAIGGRFEVDTGTLQWVMTSYSVTFAGFLLSSGRMADVFGRRLLFALGIGLFTAAALAGALAPNVAVLIVARAVQGIGAALSGPAALALISEVFSEGPQRNHAFGVYAAVGSVSASSGLVVGGVLTQLLGWRSVFAVSVAFGLLVLLAVRPALPASVRRSHSLDWWGACTVTIGLILVVFGMSRVGEAGWTNPVALTSLTVAGLLLVMFMMWERRAKEPLMPLTIFRAVSVRAGAVTAVVSYTTVVGLMFFAPLYLQNILSYSPLQSAFAVLPLSCAVFVVANYFTDRLLIRYGQRPLLIGGLILVAAGIALWMWTPLAGNYWVHVLPGVIVVGLGMGLAFPAMTAAGLTGVPQRQHGVAGAINVVGQQIGASVGVVVLVVIAAAGATSATAAGKLAGYHLAYLAAAVFCVLGALIIGIGGGWNSHPETSDSVESAGGRMN
ncbi:EmrB/QacA subfamily drug resistance transporter [Nocardia tenerifensis]|uniref:EmrB/QacA subfamily drug resistance transporter n=1 Tax=Nocardia tenerifensis TaxID=228006 RepID=A0A318K3B6_9NOCA|nr:MFS transporter [Nocardia tenerifensis]PXX63906.1 EmrB/QacA subfamily drug resistance transporter [Nocardia tenerifensis]